MQEATENCPYPELDGEPLRLELNFPQPLENVPELVVLGERMSSVAVDKFGVDGKKSKGDSVSLQRIINRIPLVKYCFFPLIIFQLLIMTLLPI